MNGAIRLSEAVDLAGIAYPRKTKNKGSVIGGKKSSIQKNGLSVQKPRVALRMVSAKQAHRNYELRKKLKRMIQEQVLHGEEAHCQICGAKEWKGRLVAEHVNTRNEVNADRYENLGVACWKCNAEKGSKRTGEYRPEWFQIRMRELDAKS